MLDRVQYRFDIDYIILELENENIKILKANDLLPGTFIQLNVYIFLLWSLDTTRIWHLYKQVQNLKKIIKNGH
jgi:hypothetical protein